MRSCPAIEIRVDAAQSIDSRRGVDKGKPRPCRLLQGCLNQLLSERYKQFGHISSCYPAGKPLIMCGVSDAIVYASNYRSALFHPSRRASQRKQGSARYKADQSHSLAFPPLLVG